MEHDYYPAWHSKYEDHYPEPKPVRRLSDYSIPELETEIKRRKAIEAECLTAASFGITPTLYRAIKKRVLDDYVNG